MATELTTIGSVNRDPSDLAVLSDFFNQDWTNPVQEELSESEQRWLLGLVSYRLMSIGRLEEALQPRELNLNMSKKQQNWKDGALSLRNLVNLQMLLGRLDDAKISAKRSLQWSYRANDKDGIIKSKAVLAHTLHYLGLLPESLNEFQLIDDMLIKYNKPWSFFYYQNAWYHELLLDMAKESSHYEVILENSQSSLDLAKQNDWPVAMSLAHLSLGRVYEILKKDDIALNHFNASVVGMRKGGEKKFLPQTLTSRATFYYYKDDIKEAQKDLNEAMDIISVCKMHLYELRALLLQANIYINQGSFKKAAKSYNSTKKKVELTNFKLLVPELLLTSAQLSLVENNFKEGTFKIKKAVACIKEKHHWGIMPLVRNVYERWTPVCLSMLPMQ